jgi:hypothetical protein
MGKQITRQKKQSKKVDRVDRGKRETGKEKGVVGKWAGGDEEFMESREERFTKYRMNSCPDARKRGGREALNENIQGKLSCR